MMKFSSELAKLDYAVALERLGGDEELLREVARLFLGEYPVLLDDIRAAMQSQDAAALERAAHTMKGSVSNFGADGAYKAAFALEQMGRTRTLDGIEDGLNRLVTELAHVHSALVELAQD
jgi:two-component system, sensor histidine kinase and response regulator